MYVCIVNVCTSGQVMQSTSSKDPVGAVKGPDNLDQIVCNQKDQVCDRLHIQ